MTLTFFCPPSIRHCSSRTENLPDTGPIPVCSTATAFLMCRRRCIGHTIFEQLLPDILLFYGYCCRWRQDGAVLRASPGPTNPFILDAAAGTSTCFVLPVLPLVDLRTLMQPASKERWRYALSGIHVRQQPSHFLIRDTLRNVSYT